MRSGPDTHQDTIAGRIRAIVLDHAGLGAAAERLADTDSLWDLGLDSLASVRVMLAVEAEFGVELPEEMLTRETFGSIHGITAAVAQLCPAP
jgi:acyl carrier protein